ncbi:nucleotide exchange factor GrpE [Candidatus Kinetoplastidibacterium crithidiae]|uniref:Protein GrpE n=1 Tax=Candidatus Kinetoplastidibacterium crithidiae TCC036E TaxID=1208918 RepID=M1LQD4_9PROT|nr:nucleotide exchange factor GrpE [Candidatus Kinetoplastibacterium crithidii]AFZ82531.1 molecular chaperone GrpE [Candidatus Kinetoplastibacterium crithidii (ex Angomonas deanei ATCC 30255)]AGF47807.1 molecular chaperone GrpE [Candidatus Kinetoplastibacterium crithidii TCC036E]
MILAYDFQIGGNDMNTKVNSNDDLQDLEVDNKSIDDLSPEELNVCLQDKLEKLESIIDNQNDKILRISAEMENVRKRSQEELVKTRKFAIESFAEGMVSVKDSLEAALLQKNQNINSLTEGVSLTLKQLDSVFKSNMLQEISPALGDKFDPTLHQAISSVKSDYPANSVVEILQKGYVISERVLRPAMVVVASSND